MLRELNFEDKLCLLGTTYARTHACTGVNNSWTRAHKIFFYSLSHLIVRQASERCTHLSWSRIRKIRCDSLSLSLSLSSREVYRTTCMRLYFPLRRKCVDSFFFSPARRESRPHTPLRTLQLTCALLSDIIQQSACISERTKVV